MSLNYKKLSELYGWDESTIRKGWVSRGLDINKPDDEIFQWVQNNVLNPLRETDLREQIDRERLRKMKAEADQQELELKKATEQVIDTDYLYMALTEHFTKIKNQLRTVPIKSYIDLYECETALELKIKLQEVIDDVLTEIGNMEYEHENEQEEAQEVTKESTESDTATTKAETK